MNSARHQSIRAKHAKLPMNTTFQIGHYFVPALLRNLGGIKNLFVRPSIGLSVRPSVCHKNSNLAHIF